MKKSKKIAIIDYQMSNMFSIRNALNYINMNCHITSNSKSILSSDGAILPGVGSFPEAMKQIKKLNLMETISNFVSTGKPFMGICLGFQLLFSESSEFKNTLGLNIFEGKVLNISDHKFVKKTPHVGWNSVNIYSDVETCIASLSAPDFPLRFDVFIILIV